MRPITDDPALPRVLLIGDSISIGYTVPVRTILAGKANVHRPLTNCGATINGLRNLDLWLGNTKWDVIHFNFGLHDLKFTGPNNERLCDPSEGAQRVPIQEYEKNLDSITRRLKKTGAAVIWRNTTPVPPGAKGRIAGDSKRYNEAAAQIMTKHEIPTHDMYSFSVKHMDEIMLKANVHFSPAGSEQLAGMVADRVSAALERRKLTDDQE